METKYSTWIPRQIERAGFVENTDFVTEHKIVPREDGRKMPQQEINHRFTLNAAKEIAMLQNSALGKLVRQYLIWAEEQLRKQISTVDNLVNSPDLLIALATRIKEQNQKLKEQQEKIELLTPPAQIGTAVSSSPGTMSMRELALLITQNGYEIGQNRLYTWMVHNNYLSKNNNGYLPLQEYQERGIFELQTRDIQSDNSRFLKSTVRITGKGVEYFLNLFREMNNHVEEPEEYRSEIRRLRLVKTNSSN